MNIRGGVGLFFVFLFSSLLLVLQVQSMRQSDRLYNLLNELESTFSGANRGGNRAEKAGEEDNRGDWLVWAYKVEPKTLNPISADVDSYAIWITIPYIFEPLLSYNFETVELEPWLAERYEISEDGLEITFVLRDDVHFSDGKAITADDVLFTYNTITDPNVDAANIANSYLDVERAEKVDDMTVRFIMNKPYFKSLENLAFTWSMGILPEHVYRYDDAKVFNQNRSNPVGSGPFVFERWESGREIVLGRNENYWGEKPMLEKIVYKFISNDLACLQALRAGTADIMIPDPEQFADVVEDEEFRENFHCLSYWTPWTPFFYIGWNQDSVFFSDRRVRLAMTHLIDRELIVSNLFRNHASTVTGPFYINSGAYDDSIEAWPYDLEKAAELLEEAGWVDTNGNGIRDKDGVEFSFKFSFPVEVTNYHRISKLLMDSAEKVGIRVIAEPFEWSVLVGRLNDREFDSVIMGWGGDILQDPYQLWHSSQIGNRGSNFVGFRDAGADKIIEKGRKTLDKAERDALYRQLHEILHEQQPYTFLFTRPTFRLVDKRFRNVNIYDLGPKYWEWYVPRSEQKYR